MLIPTEKVDRDNSYLGKNGWSTFSCIPLAYWLWTAQIIFFFKDRNRIAWTIRSHRGNAHSLRTASRCRVMEAKVGLGPLSRWAVLLPTFWQLTEKPEVAGGARLPRLPLLLLFLSRVVDLSIHPAGRGWSWFQMISTRVSWTNDLWTDHGVSMAFCFLLK